MLSCENTHCTVSPPLVLVHIVLAWLLVCNDNGLLKAADTVIKSARSNMQCGL